MKKILAAAAVTCDLRGHVHQLPKGNEDIEPVSLSQRMACICPMNCWHVPAAVSMAMR